MNTIVASAEQLHGFNSLGDVALAPEAPTILVASSDFQVADGLARLLEPYPINTVWVKGVADARIWVGTERIAACLCGFWLKDGTCREFVKQTKRESSEIPVIIVSSPACENEYREYLAAMNTGAFDFLCYPYRRLELERMLRLAIARRARRLE
ncbi:MAG TPA: hypothetical protein VGR84_12235 [Candidatus Acidoferrales bacterium]|nr:hypothetical protein [Candidatus Acidoferrales bacterium]